jgi:hypothetical protein
MIALTIFLVSLAVFLMCMKKSKSDFPDCYKHYPYHSGNGRAENGCENCEVEMLCKYGEDL